MVLKYNWYGYKPVGKLFEIELNDGDGYLMSEKAVGNDWLKKKIYTLRHSAEVVNMSRLLNKTI